MTMQSGKWRLKMKTKHSEPITKRFKMRNSGFADYLNVVVGRYS